MTIQYYLVMKLIFVVYENLASDDNELVLSHIYRLQAKLGKGNVFMGVCLSVHEGGVSIPVEGTPGPLPRY